MAYLGRPGATAPLTSADIPDNSITAAKIVTDTIAAGDLAPNSVDSSELVDGSVDNSHLADDAVGTDELANDVVISTSGAITTTGAFTSVGIDDNASGATAMTIDSSERVGIGTTTNLDQGVLTVAGQGTSTSENLLYLKQRHDSSYGWKFKVDNSSTGNLYFQRHEVGTDVSGEVVTFATDGKVGIGTTSPDRIFHIEGDNATGNSNPMLIRFTDNDTASASDQIVGGLEFEGKDSASAGVGSYIYGVAEDISGKQYLSFATGAGGNVNERMRIDSSGNVGIGTTSPAHNIDVVGTAGLTTGTAWTNTSDERIKTNIKPIENALEKIKLLRPVSFNYSKDYLDQHSELSDSKTYNSFIAQEYATVFPDAVNVGGNLVKITVESVEAKEAVLDKDGNEISPAVEAVEEVREIIVEDMLQFTPHDLNMYLVGAVKELSAKVTALENA